MAESIVAGLFGLTPQMYQNQQYQQDLSRGMALAQLSPGAAAQAGLQASVGQLGRGIAGAMGVQDPQLQKITQRQQLLTQLDLTDPKSLIEGAKIATSSGDAQLAAGLIDRARSLQESASKIALQQAQTLKAMQPQKLTGEERYIADLRLVETKIQEGKEPTKTELSNANMAAQILAKPRSFFDQASGQTVTIPATDPSKAFPETFKAMAKTEAEGGVAVPKATKQQVTAGNIPAASQREIADIEADLVKLEKTSPQLDQFSNLLKSGEVKFNAASNTFDFLGAVVPPIFGGQEVGNQVKKDEFTRAFKERVNTVLNNAKGVQARDDATRAEQQIASPSTFLSTARMQGAINYLKKAEAGYKEELEARRGSLQRQGQPEEKPTPSAKPTEQKQTPKPTTKVSEMSREQMIDLVIQHNASKGVTVTRSQAEKALRDAKKL
jgi:hypothetical protein